jgi:hypothetical protein
MGLIIDWTYDKKPIKAYLKVASIGVERGLNGSAPNFRGGGMQTSNKIDDFVTTISYEIYDVKGGKLISRGLFKSLYDLGSQQNVIAEVYKKLKAEHEDCKTAKDEV